MALENADSFDLKLPLKPYEAVVHKGVDFVRYCFSFLPKIGVVKPPPKRPNGVSVIFRSCNDEWAEHSLKSIKDFADEIIVVDASTDDTPARIKKVAREEGLNLNFIHMDVPLDSLMGDTETYVYQSNVGLRCAKYRWVVIWDADHIAYTSGPNDIMKLKKFLLDLILKSTTALT